MHVFKVRGWHLPVLALVILALIVLGVADGAWWRAIIAGVALPLTPVPLSELPIALLEAYNHSRWAEGVDVWLDPGGEDLYVLLRWGQQPTGGYRIVACGARLLKRYGQSVVIVRATYVTPEPGQPVIEVASFPAAGVRLDVRGYSVAGSTVQAVDQYGRVRGSPARVQPQAGTEQL